MAGDTPGQSLNPGPPSSWLLRGIQALRMGLTLPPRLGLLPLNPGPSQAASPVSPRSCLALTSLEKAGGKGRWGLQGEQGSLRAGGRPGWACPAPHSAHTPWMPERPPSYEGSAGRTTEPLVERDGPGHWGLGLCKRGAGLAGARKGVEGGAWALGDLREQFLVAKGAGLCFV